MIPNNPIHHIFTPGAPTQLKIFTCFQLEEQNLLDDLTVECSKFLKTEIPRFVHELRISFHKKILLWGITDCRRKNDA